ncbi:30S ribosomal protein S3 [Patescibacteria group bacterium]|nr:30S ribosomal protein S3 [Candidatus Falkowbacteria bacterium]MBU3905439.1 30S ribosomal protein S3 [Patescibacteria group bacterium]MCG2697901.1 30S ribosomal protein S3 [Candidatus Parcubacteria bacterium]MBU4014801.1 30S ribosomal protein S3 [Patescibacteria group bacterium]MBU4027107.1 30S ribosomal protein S3 [Patescibacteria group bacterium]
MGQKVNPKIFRMGITRSWHSKWFSSGKKYIEKFSQDIKIRKFFIKELREAGVDRVEIERSANKINISIFTAKPGLIIGRGGMGVEDLKKKIHKKFLSRPSGIRLSEINLNITEFDRPNLSAQILVQSIALDLEKRMPFRRIMKQAVSRVTRAGALGVKVIVKGRLNGAEIARSEMLTSGKVPLHTLRADIDYARGAARTIYGAIGIKVWIYKGEVFKKEEEKKGEVVGAKLR